MAQPHSRLRKLQLVVIYQVSLEGTAFEVKHLQQLVAWLDPDAVLLKAQVDALQAIHLDSVEAVDPREQRLFVFLGQEVNHLWQHAEELLLLRRLQALDDEFSVLREEEEASALAPDGVRLAVVRLEDLETVVLGVDRLHDLFFVDLVHLPDLGEGLGCIHLDASVDDYALELVL